MKTYVRRKSGMMRRRCSRRAQNFQESSENIPQRQSIQRILRNTGVQAKLSVGQPNDKYEKEADHVANQVIQMPDATVLRQPEPEESEESVQAKPIVDQITPLVQRQPEEEEEQVQAKLIQRQPEDEEETAQAKLIQRQSEEEEETAQAKLIQRQAEEEEESVQAKSETGNSTTVSSHTESNINSMKGGGRPLDAATRSYFEPRFGTDFSNVRVHHDGRAAETAKSIQARAFTLGNNVAFGQGEYAPGSSEGKRLLAHELTHVVQQNGKSAGNKQVRRDMVQRDPAEDQAKLDYTKFKAEGPYEWENYTVGKNGKFDVKYWPTGNKMDVNMKVKFIFPMTWVAAFLESGVSKAMRKARERRYREAYIRKVTMGWTKKFDFRNVRAPSKIWNQLNPTKVHVNVKEVEAGQHFSIKAQPDKVGGAQVDGGVTELYKDDERPQEKFNPGTRQGELKRVKRINPSPIKFANNSAVIPDVTKPKLSFLATYLKRINNPKFKLLITGHSNTSGELEYNQKLSEQRATAVEKKLKDDGLTNHDIQSSGVGQAGATVAEEWRKVVIKEDIPAGWKNKQDVTVHEFGHMIGLGDEYAGPTANATHYDLVKRAFGQDYADQVAKREGTDAASIMEGGDDVRIQHYVTFWKALVDTTKTKPTVPMPKFGFRDWKFKG